MKGHHISLPSISTLLVETSPSIILVKDSQLPPLLSSNLESDNKQSSQKQTSYRYPDNRPSIEIILNEAGEPILKRKRGRPPYLTLDEGGWTLLTPTVWNVKQQDDINSEIHRKRGRKPKKQVAGNSCFALKETSIKKKKS